MARKKIETGASVQDGDNAEQTDQSTEQVNAGKPRRPRRMAREAGAATESTATPNASEAQMAPAPAPRPTSKIAQVIALLERAEGATLAELVEATSWLPHTTRAALTGLKKKGRVIAKDKRGDVTCYRIGGAA